MNDYIDREWLREMCGRIDLLEYASQTHDFRRCGYDNYAAKCELHNDNDPSLTITPSKNLWYCHGCKRGGDLVSWMMVYEGLDFRQVVDKIAKLTGESIPKFNQSSSFSAMKSIRTASDADVKDISKRKIFQPSFYEKFKAVPHEPHEWIEEGISEEVLRRFDIRIDEVGNRIVYPVYDNDDNLIGVKGRTRYKNYKALGIAKYNNYVSIGTVDYFQGMHENRDFIKRSGEIIIFEGLKSVMKAATWGVNNAVSAETSRLNDGQVEVLLKLGVDSVVIAFDKDVQLSQLMSAARKIKRFVNVYVITDTEHLLGEKDAPVDLGKDVWEKLYGNRKRII